MHRSSRRSAAALCVLVTASVTACSSPAGGGAASKPTTGLTTSSAALSVSAPRKSAAVSAPRKSAGSALPRSSAATAAQLGSQLASIALKKSDFTHAFSVGLMSGGDQVTGQVTLDNCGFNFTTEAYRVARRQYVVGQSAPGDTGLSNELVAYDTPSHAALAVAQWHTAAATCPHRAVRSTVAGQPDLVITILHVGLNVATLPAKSNAVTVESGRATGKQMLYNLSILQVRGRYLDAVYLTTPTPITGPELTATQRLAVITGQRLLTLQ